MKKSEVTKNYKKWYIIVEVLDFICLVCPLLVAVIFGYIESTTIQKVTLTGALLFAIIMIAINFLFKLNFKCFIWIVLLAVYMIINRFYPFLLAVAITGCVDELILTPLAKNLKQKFIINKQIDKRLNV